MLRFHTRGIAQYLECASQVAASFIVTQFIFTASEKQTSEPVDVAGDRCMSITVIQHYIVIER